MIPPTHQRDEDYIQIDYANGYVRGLPIQNDVSLTETEPKEAAGSTAKGIYFLGKSTSLMIGDFEYEGALGLAPKPRYMPKSEEGGYNRWLLTELKQSKAISKEIFGLLYARFGF